MTRSRQFLIGSTALALALTGAALARPPAQRGRGPAARLDRVVRQLDLSAGQRSSAEALADRVEKESIEQRGRIEYLRYEMHKLMQAERPERERILAKADELGQATTALRKLRISARLELRELLTPEQQAQARDLLEEWRERRGDRRGRDRKRADHAGAGPARD